MDGIFISYRRDDSAGYAGRLYDRLAAHFGAGRVFMDVEGIEPGTDFVTAIENAVGSCRVLIVVIGDEWLNTTDAAGRRRLDDPNDFIRLETAIALKRNIRVVPVLVGGALMPRAEDLPEELRPLARRQAIEVSHKQWEASTAELIRALDSLLPGAGDPVDPPLPPPDDSSWRRWLAGAGVVFAVIVAGWWGLSGPARETHTEASSRPTLSAGAPAREDTPSPASTSTPAAAAVAARPPPVEVAAAPTSPVDATRAPARPTTITPPAATATAPARVAVAPPAPTPKPPAPAPAPAPAIAPPISTPPRAAAAPDAARAPTPDSRLPRAGETWTYTTSGKWPTSPKRTVVIGVQSVAAGQVTDTLRADPSAGVPAEVRNPPAGAPGFVNWSLLGNEFSPYLGAFTDLSALGTQRGFTTPSVDGQWGQWYSEARVLGQEPVTVPAGRFNAYKVEVSSNRQPSGGAGSMQVEPVRIHYLIWYAPEVKRYVKMQRRVIVASGAENEKDLFELVAHR
ncbi:toll/interleukin-1 receptor domain-containing protein [Hydrogenophaga sp. IBVHS1]|uniref:toll/interleukin-1 receptor domain-containing protein n=1 Tax=Hydrogenophaga sp. IBVHS1 TaxID=1985169 RepID=UPI0015C506C3|nr:toll/interleukin-1 receptor domain-containing protein [Hydrogenophaga sp. IBVHS1]